jgi:hypothetical protein
MFAHPCTKQNVPSFLYSTGSYLELEKQESLFLGCLTMFQIQYLRTIQNDSKR